jgi:hypothetical protein
MEAFSTDMKKVRVVIRNFVFYGINVTKSGNGRRLKNRKENNSIIFAVLKILYNNLLNRKKLE